MGTRRIWNQHAYSVSNICGDSRACPPGSTYGDIPANRVPNWTVPFLNNFRQNIQGEGIFDAPDVTLASLNIKCESTKFVFEAFVRNFGAALLPAGVEVGFYVVEAGGGERLLGTATTTAALFPGQVSSVTLDVDLAASSIDVNDSFFARIEIDPNNRTFRECREDNNESDVGSALSQCLF